MRQTVLRVSGPTVGSWASTCTRSARLYRLSGWARWVGGSQATALTVASARGGKRPRSTGPGTLGQRGQGEAGLGPALAPLADPVRMLAQLRGRGGVPHGGLGLQEQGQLRALHQPLLAGRPT